MKLRQICVHSGRMTSAEVFYTYTVSVYQVHQPFACLSDTFQAADIKIMPFVVGIKANTKKLQQYIKINLHPTSIRICYNPSKENKSQLCIAQHECVEIKSSTETHCRTQTKIIKFYWKQIKAADAFLCVCGWSHRTVFNVCRMLYSASHKCQGASPFMGVSECVCTSMLHANASCIV